MQYPYGHAQPHRHPHHHQVTTAQMRVRLDRVLHRSAATFQLPAMPEMTPVGKRPIDLEHAA